MIKEFAVDPKVFSTWSEFRIWSERFGPSTGRMIAQFPENWKTRTKRGIEQAELQPVKRKAMKERLKKFGNKLVYVPRNYDYNDDLSWIDNAVFVHREIKPTFHAIVSTDKSSFPEVLDADIVDEDTPEFIVPKGKLVPKTPEAMSGIIELFLRTARQIKFIDPYFDPVQASWRTTLHAFLSKLDMRLCCGPIEYHLRYDSDSSPSSMQFELDTQRYLTRVVPVGMQVRFIRWRVVGEKFHARYVLDDRIGYSFDHGLGEMKNQSKTDIHIIDESVRRERWVDFDGRDTVANANRAFEFFDSVTVIGKC